MGRRSEEEGEGNEKEVARQPRMIRKGKEGRRENVMMMEEEKEKETRRKKLGIKREKRKWKYYQR